MCFSVCVFLPLRKYRHVICRRHSDCHCVTPLSVNNHHKRRPPPHTTPRNRRTTGDSDTTTVHNTRSRGFCEKQGGPNESFGPGYVFFFFFLSFLLTFIIFRVIRPTDPPSLQERVGGLFLHVHGPTLATNASRWAVILLFYTNRPTLATNASRWVKFIH